MKTLKSIAFTVALALGTFGAVTYTSCTSDECKDVVCNNGGTCIDGNCSCPTGFEGSDCGTETSSKFKGTWGVTEKCGNDQINPYQVTITASSPTQIEINNLGNYDCTVGGTITFNGVTKGTTGFTINDTKCNTEMIAEGTLNNDGTITVTYTAKYGVSTDQCTATLKK